jgi:hypothetical protein
MGCLLRFRRPFAYGDEHRPIWGVGRSRPVSFPDYLPWRPAVGIPPRICAAEMVTLLVMQALLGHTSEARWLRLADQHLATSRTTFSPVESVDKLSVEGLNRRSP